MKTATAPLPPLRSVKVLDQLRERIRYLHYSLRTEQAYVHWVRAFIRFHGVRHPATLGSSEVEAFLSWLANERKVSVSTHRQALAALLFFYGKVLCTDLPWLQEIGRPRPSRRLPVVLTPDEVVRILGFLEGEHRLFAQLLYGTGMRISEGLQLRVKDLDFDHGTIIVREGKGSKDRALMLPESLAPSLREQLSRMFGRAVDVVSRNAVNPDFLPDEDKSTPQLDLLARVERELPVRLDQERTDMVVCHGDPCMPNFMVDPKTLQCTGLIDLGRLGTADRYADLALMIANAEENWAAPDEAERAFAVLFNVLGIEAPDRERLAFYLRLDPLTWG